MTALSPFAPREDYIPLPVKGVRYATHFCGLKESGGDDLLLVSLAPETSVAGVFTQSSTAAAPVDFCKAHLKQGQARGLIVHSGNANAFTGRMGEAVVRETTDKVAALFDCPPEQIFSAATGVIGQPFPSEKVVCHLEDLSKELDEAGGADAARAIMTTDTFPKSLSSQIETSVGTITLTGLAKGAGMIAPDMATLLSFIFTDAKIEASRLQRCLSIGNQTSYSKISVDGDTSTNDTLLLFATGQTGERELNDADMLLFQDALNKMLKDLALLIVKDGEGVSKFITVDITGARTDAEALAAGRSVAGSPLVKTAIAGGHANWGRVVMAVGKSGATLDKREMSVSFGDFLLAQSGDPIAHGRDAELADYMSGDSIHIRVDLAAGEASETIYTCDLTHGYIDINAHYTT